MTNQEHQNTCRQYTSKIESLYIHIPFCKKKCNYCDFVSYAGKEELIDEYVEALIGEAKALTPIFFNKTLPSGNPLPEVEGKFRCGLKTIYIGGGTPTIFEPRHFEKLLDLLKTTFIFDSNNNIDTNGDIEISIEANPGTADLEKLKALRKLGINRISIGCQSFNDKHLKTLGRIHDSNEIYRFYKDARAAGFENINLDLIFALPDQTLDEWKDDLKKALELAPEHISTYNLQIEEGTPFWSMTNDKFQMTNKTQNPNLKLPDNEIEADMYEYAIEALKKVGYKHYEISNFAKPGFECQHNIVYWKNQNYIGIGAGAHSHLNGKRWQNPDSIKEYLDQDPLPVSALGARDSVDQRETIFMGLRLLDGLPIKYFSGFEKEAAELIEEGLLIKETNNYKLTHRGLLLGNEVFRVFV